MRHSCNFLMHNLDWRFHKFQLSCHLNNSKKNSKIVGNSRTLTYFVSILKFPFQSMDLNSCFEIENFCFVDFKFSKICEPQSIWCMVLWLSLLKNFKQLTVCSCHDWFFFVKIMSLSLNFGIINAIKMIIMFLDFLAIAWQID